MANITTIYSLANFVDCICKLSDFPREEMDHHRYVHLFRGQASAEHALLPSIGRGRDFAADITIFNEERNLIEMAKYRMPDVFRDDLLPVELLALLQHHGIPTRLLDITENALVALYFACCSDFEKDGEVIVFRHKEDDVTMYPVINAIADSYRLARGTFTFLDLFYGAAKKQPYCLEQLQSYEICHNDDKAGGKWIEECCQDILYIYAPFRTPRQQAQQGRYILFPNNIVSKPEGNSYFEKILAPISKEHEDIVARFIIPKELKEKLLLNLSIFGITESALFCDNIDIVCQEIKNTFTREINTSNFSV